MDWELSVLALHQGTVLFGLVRTARDDAKIEASRRAWVRGMGILDAQLASSDYVAGDAFTLADIPLAPIAHRFFNLDIDRPDCANVQRRYDTLAARPAVQKWVVVPLQ